MSENKSLDDKVVSTGQQDDESVYKILAEVDGPSTPSGISDLSAKQPPGGGPAVVDQKYLENKEDMQSLHPAKSGDVAAGSDGWNGWDTCKMEKHEKTKEEEKEENGERKSVAPPLVHTLSSSGEHIETGSASNEDQPEGTPTAQLFFDIVPHIRSVTALVSRPSHNEDASVQPRAEDTAKTLLLTWMGMDLDFIFEDGGDSDPWNLAGHQPPAETKDTYSHTYSHTTPSHLSQYQQLHPHAPYTWLPQHQLYLAPALSYLYPQYQGYFPAPPEPPDTYQQPTPPPAAPAIVRPPPASLKPDHLDSPTASKNTTNDIIHIIETESEDQDLTKLADYELPGSGQQLEHLMEEKQTEQELQTAVEVEEVVILKDAVGRSLKLPFDSCKTKDVCL